MPGAAQGGTGATAVVRLTSRATGEVQELRLVSKAPAPRDGQQPPAAAAAARRRGLSVSVAAAAAGTGLGLLEPAPPSGDNPPLASEAAEVA